MGNWKFWAMVVIIAGIGWAWHTGLIPDFFDQMGGNMASDPDKYIED
jgi:hypothetical protein